MMCVVQRSQKNRTPRMLAITIQNRSNGATLIKIIMKPFFNVVNCKFTMITMIFMKLINKISSFQKNL